MSSVRDQFDNDLQSGIRMLNQWHVVEARILYSIPDMQAQHYDGEGSSARLWCEDCERDLHECRKEEERDGILLGCEGVPDMKMTDPVGNAAVMQEKGPIWVERQIHEEMRLIHHHMRKLEGLVVGVMKEGKAPPPKDTEMPNVRASQAAVAKANMPKCERHLRYGHEVESRTINGTRVKKGVNVYVLQDPVRLCEWCEDTTRTLDRLPTEQEIAGHVLGKRLRVAV